MKRLEYWIDRIVAFCKQLDPDCVVETTTETFEGEDAYITVWSHLDEDDLFKKTSFLTCEAILDNYFIVLFPRSIQARKTITV